MGGVFPGNPTSSRAGGSSRSVRVAFDDDDDAEDEGEEWRRWGGATRGVEVDVARRRSETTRRRGGDREGSHEYARARGGWERCS